MHLVNNILSLLTSSFSFTQSLRRPIDVFLQCIFSQCFSLLFVADMDDSLQCDVSSAPSDRASSTLDTITDTTEGGRCSGPLDSALPSDSDPNLEANHSSEEELEVINCGAARCPEKRKWSQANTGQQRRQPGPGSAASSDDEVRDLMCASAPVEFRASPPANVPKPSRSLSPPPKLFHHDAIPPHELCALASPRALAAGRRRRALLAAAAAAASTNPDAVHRPSLDFEKMQQVGRQPSSILCTSAHLPYHGRNSDFSFSSTFQFSHQISTLLIAKLFGTTFMTHDLVFLIYVIYFWHFPLCLEWQCNMKRLPCV